MNKEIRDRLSAISILYLLIAIADEDFQLMEAEQIIKKLKEWRPDINEDDLESIINEAQELLANGDHAKLFNSSGDLIRKYFDEDNKVNVLRDLINIALVDDDFNEYEFTLIQVLIKNWCLKDKVEVAEYVKHLKLMKEVDRQEKEQEEQEEDEKEEVTEKEQVATDESDKPDEVIAEVYKDGSNYRAKIKGAENDITEIIGNPSKLKYAYERSGLIRGKKNKSDEYDWRVIRKK